jgi:hypothetical protein
MIPNEVNDVVLTDVVDIFPVAVTSPRFLKAILQPAILNPPGNFLMVLPEAQLKFVHRVTISYAPGGAHTLQLVHD